MPSTEEVSLGKQQQRGAGIPVIIGASAGAATDSAAVSSLTGAGIDGLACAFSDLRSLALAANPRGSRDSPQDCVDSIIGAGLLA